jgi:hypothetical protein
MITESLPPDPQLFDSMRAVGYSLPTALADIIDNSVSAEATKVQVMFDANVMEPFVYVIDNGRGMDGNEARISMQLAGTGSATMRSSGDLGRFGLGLKTASLSQCRRLTVATKKDGEVSVLQWDLVHLSVSRSWDLIVLDAQEASDLPGFAGLREMEHGTLVVWQDLDRVAAQMKDFGRLLDSQMIEAATHLSLVFHRFLSGDGHPRVEIAVNSIDLAPADPFLEKSHGTQPSLVESIDVAGTKITVQAFTLPFTSRMTARERKKATANGDLRESQGFYIYRAGRLVIWGTWFRLIARADMSKLTRVKVDIPNSLDSLWSLDIKKSSAAPPAIVRERLASLATTFVKPSERAHSYRGRKPSSEDPTVRAWAAIEDREAVRYVLNTDHPLISALTERLDQTSIKLLDDLILVLENTLPLQDIYNRFSRDEVAVEPSNQAEQSERWKNALLLLWSISKRSESSDEFLDRMLKAEPFSGLAASRALLELAIYDTEEWR